MPHLAHHSSMQHHLLLDAGHQERASDVRGTGVAILVALAVGIGIATVGHSARAWLWGDDGQVQEDSTALEAPSPSTTR